MTTQTDFLSDTDEAALPHPVSAGVAASLTAGLLAALSPLPAETRAAWRQAAGVIGAGDPQAGASVFAGTYPGWEFLTALITHPMGARGAAAAGAALAAGVGVFLLVRCFEDAQGRRDHDWRTPAALALFLANPALIAGAAAGGLFMFAATLFLWRALDALGRPPAHGAAIRVALAGLCGLLAHPVFLALGPALAGGLAFAAPAGARSAPLSYALLIAAPGGAFLLAMAFLGWVFLDAPFAFLVSAGRDAPISPLMIVLALLAGTAVAAQFAGPRLRLRIAGGAFVIGAGAALSPLVAAPLGG